MSSIRRVLPFSASTTPTQAATYLLGISLFSIAFLVFLNSAISFVVTDLVGQKTRVGDAVGTLGFADELVALLACPAWGLLSDRLGVRAVAVTGYAIVGAALALLVQARNVYPELLLARMFFAVGGAATTTMVTAILPTLTDESAGGKPAVLAGYVGLFTGCGALLALALFLPLPARFAALDGVSSAQAVQYSFYVVAAAALAVAAAVARGLRDIKAERGKSWRLLLGLRPADAAAHRAPPYLHLFRASLRLGRSDSRIALGYLGGFVARASSVAISLFIPLFVNTFFIRNGFCHADPHDPSPDLKRDCRQAYLLSAALTGAAQLVALLCAPLFGHASSRLRPGRTNWPVLIAAAAGIIGYSVFPRLASPEFRDTDHRGGGPLVFLVVALIGISQIGCIVCSLGSLGRGILAVDSPATTTTTTTTTTPTTTTTTTTAAADDHGGEDQPLIAEARDAPAVRLKGSISGVYSLCGGFAILLLTKVGGLLFDRWSNGAPFYMMALFNAVLLVATLAVQSSQAFCV